MWDDKVTNEAVCRLDHQLNKMNLFKYDQLSEDLNIQWRKALIDSFIRIELFIESFRAKEIRIILKSTMP